MQTRHHHPGGCWPTEPQELLLKACLLESSAWRDAYEEWQQLVCLDDVDRGSFRLLPLLYSRLKAESVASPVMGRLKGICRHGWYKNQLLFRYGATAIKALSEAGIETIVLKGVPLAFSYYRTTTDRPMQDVDLLVPTAKALRAAQVLEQSGWSAKSAYPMELRLQCHSGHAFKNDRGGAVDLHWHVLSESLWEDADTAFWSESEPFSFGGVATRSLGATDLLFHVMVHGLAWCRVPSVRWVADSAHVLRDGQHGPVDWSRLLSVAKTHNLLCIVRDGLAYLRNKLAIAIPQSVIEASHKPSPSVLAQADYWARQRDFSRFFDLPVLFFRYVRLCDGSGQKPSPLGYARFVASVFGSPDLPGFAYWAASRGVHKVRSTLSQRR